MRCDSIPDAMSNLFTVHDSPHRYPRLLTFLKIRRRTSIVSKRISRRWCVLGSHVAAIVRVWWGALKHSRDLLEER